MFDLTRKISLCHHFHDAGKIGNILYCAPCVAFISAILICQIYLFIALILH